MLMLWPHLRPIKSESEDEAQISQHFKISNIEQLVWRKVALQNPVGLNQGFSMIPCMTVPRLRSSFLCTTQVPHAIVAFLFERRWSPALYTSVNLH